MIRLTPFILEIFLLLKKILFKSTSTHKYPYFNHSLFSKMIFPAIYDMKTLTAIEYIGLKLI